MAVVTCQRAPIAVFALLLVRCSALSKLDSLESVVQPSNETDVQPDAASGGRETLDANVSDIAGNVSVNANVSGGTGPETVDANVFDIKGNETVNANMSDDAGPETADANVSFTAGNETVNANMSDDAGPETVDAIVFDTEGNVTLNANVSDDIGPETVDAIVFDTAGNETLNANVSDDIGPTHENSEAVDSGRREQTAPEAHAAGPAHKNSEAANHSHHEQTASNAYAAGPTHQKNTPAHLGPREQNTRTTHAAGHHTSADASAASPKGSAKASPVAATSAAASVHSKQGHHTKAKASAASPAKSKPCSRNGHAKPAPVAATSAAASATGKHGVARSKPNKGRTSAAAAKATHTTKNGTVRFHSLPINETSPLDANKTTTAIPMLKASEKQPGNSAKVTSHVDVKHHSTKDKSGNSRKVASHSDDEKKDAAVAAIASKAVEDAPGNETVNANVSDAAGVNSTGTNWPQSILICNIFVEASLLIFSPELPKNTSLPFKVCQQVALPTVRNATLQFMAESKIVGSFTITASPEDDTAAMALAVFSMQEDPDAAEFQSHQFRKHDGVDVAVFASTAAVESVEFQERVARRSLEAAPLHDSLSNSSELTHNSTGLVIWSDQTSEELPLNAVVSMAPGDYRIQANDYIHAFKAEAGGSYVVVVVGDDPREEDMLIYEATAGAWRVGLNGLSVFVLAAVAMILRPVRH